MSLQLLASVGEREWRQGEDMMVAMPVSTPLGRLIEEGMRLCGYLPSCIGLYGLQGGHYPVVPLVECR